METQEEFRAVKGYEGKYEVSNLGRVKSLNYHREKREAFLSGSIDRYGYHKVVFCLHGIQTSYLVHRLVAGAFVDLSSNLNAISVNHIDGNKSNNNSINLEWLSMSDNVKHAYAIGLSNCQGENSGMSKLTDLLVSQIREDYKTLPTIEIARKFNISTGNISAIVKGVTWKHLPVINYTERKTRIMAVVPGFIEAANKVHNVGTYDYSKVNYINSRTSIIIICPKHGEFNQLPKGHIVGQGCPKCAVVKRKVSLLNKKVA